MVNKVTEYKFGFSVQRRVRMMVGTCSKKATLTDWHRCRGIIIVLLFTWVEIHICKERLTISVIFTDDDQQTANVWTWCVTQCMSSYLRKTHPRTKSTLSQGTNLWFFFFTFYFAQPWVHLLWIAYSYSISMMSVSFQVYWWHLEFVFFLIWSLDR